MAIAVAGFLLSLVIGAPIGTFVASFFSWHITFVGIGLATVLLTAINRLVWPPEVLTAPHASTRFPAHSFGKHPTHRSRHRRCLFRLHVSGHRTTNPLIADSIAAALILYGIGAVSAAGYLIDRYGASRIVLLSFVLLAATLLVLDLARLAVPGARSTRTLCPDSLPLFSCLSISPGRNISSAHWFGLCLEQLF